MQKYRLAMVAIVLIAASPSRAQYIPTPSGSEVGPWRTGVAVHCPDGHTVPAGTAISGPDETPEQLCGINPSTATNSAAGPKISNTGNLQQDTLTNGVNMLIVSNVKNPVMSSFMQGAATSFISSMFTNNAEADRQRALMEQAIRQEREEAERQRRIAEQQRLDAMYARLNASLKLDGLPFELNLKGMTSSLPDTLQMKGISSSGPADLKLKLDDPNATSYGLKGLPGVYLGGPQGPDSGSANPQSTASGANGDNPNSVTAPGTGSPGRGIPGLQGIYLDSVQPSQAPLLAQAAQNMTGQERTISEDSAIHAAENNPAFVQPSGNPNLQQFQQADRDYKQALATNSAAGQQLDEAQRHVEADQSAIAIAREKLASISPSVDQQQAFNQMISAAKSDEEASVLARQNFDSTSVALSSSRERATSALVQAAPAAVQISSYAGPVIPTHDSTPSPSPSPVAPRAVSPPTLALQRPAAGKSARISDLPQAPAAPVLKIPAAIDACLAAANHGVAPASRPTVEELHQQLDSARESLTRLLEGHLRENEEREEWVDEMNKSGVSIRHTAFDLTVKTVLGHYADNAKEEADWASLYSNKQTYEDAKEAQERFKQAAEAADKIATVRDVDQIYRDDTDPKKRPGDNGPKWDALKLGVKAFLSRQDIQHTLARWAKYSAQAGEAVPFVDDTVTWAGAAIDTAYDLTVEYQGFARLQQTDQNSELFYRGAAVLQKKIRTTADQLKCFR